MASQGIDDNAPSQPPSAAPGHGCMQALHAEVTAATAAAVAAVDDERRRELQATGERLRAEQDRLFAMLVDDVPRAAREAAAAGRRTAVVLAFDGVDKLGEFCYLYMIKGPVRREEREEMRAMRAAPLLPRLRRALKPFEVHHAWQRATNQNVLSVTW